jgi:pimeloyl-ACP methyl ester carboxylesterase
LERTLGGAEGGTHKVSEYHDEVVPFVAGDGMACNLVHLVAETPPTRGPVILVHGAGVRANIFRAPIDRPLVDLLMDEGYDVWLENWRASLELKPNQWTLDKAAVFDHPKAVDTIVERTGADEVKAVIHCQGSCSFMMAAVAGLLPRVSTVVSNAVSLHTVIPTLARWKMQYLHCSFRAVTRYLNPAWALESPDLVSSAFLAWVRLVHRECENDVCKMVSFAYGVGKPTLWSHDNLNDETHEWMRHEFGFCPISFYLQMSRCLQAGYLVPVDGLPGLPQSFVDRPPATDARFALFAGANNRCFLPAGQERTYGYLDAQRPNYHSLHVLPGYGHLDVFMGKNAPREVFPLILEELSR